MSCGCRSWDARPRRSRPRISASTRGSRSSDADSYEHVLRRPALSRALLLALAARSRGVVQGHRARRALVAREPAAADGDLPGRLLAALAGDRPGLSGSFPAHGARALGVLRELAPGRLEEPARGCGAD